MRKVLYTFTLALFLSFSFSFSQAQTQKEIPPEAFDLYPTLKAMYGYAYGWHENNLLIVGGKIKSDVPQLAAEDFPNTELILLNFDKNRATAFSSGSLEGIIFEQMSSTGLEFYQKGHILYLIGGYGYHDKEERFITFPYITAIDLEAAISAMLNGEIPSAFFYQICDERLAIFDGILDFNQEEYFLMNGKKAQKTNPFSEDSVYVEEKMTGQIRTFTISGENENLKIQNFQDWHDLEAFYEYYGPLLPEKIKKEVLRALNLEKIR